MISFEAPQYLRYGWLLPLLVAGYLLSRYATRRASRALAQPGPRWQLPRLQLGLHLLALALLVLALAGPQPALPARAAAPTRVATRLVFVVDVSRSMLAGDVLPNRLTQAKKVVAEAARQLPGAEIGVVIFAGSAQLYLPLTTDYEVVSQASQQLSPAAVARQGTSLAEALALAGQVLQAPPRRGRVLCVLSDGESHTQGYAALADSLRRAGIGLFAIGIGTPEGAQLFTDSPTAGAPSPKTDRQGQPIRTQLQAGQLQRLVQGQPDHYIRLDTWRNATTRLLQAVRQLDPPAAPPGSAAAPIAYWQQCLVAAFGVLLLTFFVPSRQQL